MRQKYENPGYRSTLALLLDAKLYGKIVKVRRRGGGGGGGGGEGEGEGELLSP